MSCCPSLHTAQSRQVALVKLDPLGQVVVVAHPGGVRPAHHPEPSPVVAEHHPEVPIVFGLAREPKRLPRRSLARCPITAGHDTAVP